MQGAWPRDEQPLTHDQVKTLQSALNDRGFAAGTPDGQMGPTTRQALRAWQRSLGLPADGFPTLDQLTKLQTP